MEFNGSPISAMSSSVVLNTIQVLTIVADNSVEHLLLRQSRLFGGSCESSTWEVKI